MNPNPYHLQYVNAIHISPLRLMLKKWLKAGQYCDHFDSICAQHISMYLKHCVLVYIIYIFENMLYFDVYVLMYCCCYCFCCLFVCLFVCLVFCLVVCLFCSGVFGTSSSIVYLHIVSVCYLPSLLTPECSHQLLMFINMFHPYQINKQNKKIK